MVSLAPDVSVIIAAYNVATTIERAIHSALHQPGVAVEVIVVDDGSQDGTATIVAALNDPRIKLRQLPGNGGPSVARNKGMALASAPWLAILDGDDAFGPERLARCLRLAAATQADIVVDNLELHGAVEHSCRPMFPPARFAKYGTLDLATFIRGNRFMFGRGSLGYLKPIFSAAFLRQHQLRYDPDIRIGEDYMLMAEALACGARCVVEPQAGYHYTVRAGSISHRLSQTDIADIISADTKFIAHYQLDRRALRAQKGRSFSLRELSAFADLVTALKQKQTGHALSIVLKRPTVILHLWRPLWARLQRWQGKG